MNQAEYEEYMFGAQFYDALNTMSKIEDLKYGKWLSNYMKQNNVRIKSNIEKNKDFIKYCKEQFEKHIPKGYKGLVSFKEWIDYNDFPLQESCLKEDFSYMSRKKQTEEDFALACDMIWRQYKVDLIGKDEYICKNESEANGIYEILKDFDINVMKNGTHLSFN